MTFRGASAEAYSALTSTLEGALGKADAAQVGQDLFSVAEVLRAEPALRRVATDVSVESTAKAGLVSELFAGKVQAPVAALLGDAVSQRWTYASDLAKALEQLGVVATVRSAGSDAGRLSTELFQLGQLLKDNPDLRQALSDPARSTEDKRALVHGLLAGKALPATVALVDQSLAGTHRTVSVALDAYQQVVAEANGRAVATVTVAKELAASDLERINAALARQYEREVQLNVVVDPAVIGGVKVEIGGEVIDGTVASRLDDARRKLAV
ncbi:F0F1 ATP synthase subunit delta [Nocardioides sp. Y6]|uniref:ATP synthase subunit delta n=1 Tax=Nocardioides malaquae TaxID=2773426 RepID=A0ABR9RPY8_9ACTN|nr:F0F1 ATP synthase subunit delta [Nocardioides malaquae]MBE7323631.1 F0F1 ATP synthase subunit delta [Nocardioides malaquae]